MSGVTLSSEFAVLSEAFGYGWSDDASGSRSTR